MKIRVLPFEEFNQRVKDGADKCEFITWKINGERQGFHLLMIEEEIFVPIPFAEKLLEMTFAAS